MATRQWGLIGTALVWMMLASCANACIVEPFSEAWANRGTATWAGTDSDCRLESSVISSAQANTAAAVVHHRREPGSGPVRLSFRIHAPPASGMNSMALATVAKGVAKRSPNPGPSQAELFSIALFGNAAGTRPIIGISAACSSCEASGGIKSTTVAINHSDFPIKVTVELSIGSGAAGQLKYWIGADDTSLEPTRTPLGDLDNARWERVERVSLGISDTSALWRSIMAGNLLTLDQISVSRATMFFGDFDSDDADNVATTIATPLPSNTIYQGNTCNGSAAFPQIAAGTTSFRGPVSVQQMTIPPESSGRVLSIASTSATMGAFVCRAGGGPASPCLTSGEPGSPVVLPSGFAGTYWVIVGAVGRVRDGNCGDYSLQVNGPLG